MTQLRSLALTHPSYGDMAATLPSLTGLTKLVLNEVDFDSQRRTLKPSLFTALHNLRSLELSVDNMHVEDLEQLTALTHLFAGLVAKEPRRPLTIAPVWPMPPRLRSLTFHGSEIDIGVLGCLQLPQCLERVACDDDELEIELTYGVHTDPDGRLLPAMEGALANALDLLARARDEPVVDGEPPAEDWPGYSVGIVFDNDDSDEFVMLRPQAGGLVGAAAGADAALPRGHLPWLEALAAVRPAELNLENIMLDEADLRCIAGMTSLKALSFEDGKPSFPVGALPLLGILPRLGRLELCTRPLVRQPQEEVAQAIKRLCTAAAPRRLDVVLKPYDGISDDSDDDDSDDDDSGDGDSDDDEYWGGTRGHASNDDEQSQALLARVNGLLGGAGLAPGMVRLEARSLRAFTWSGVNMTVGA
ncbi:hypothetical protein GPECTOR_25g406 [Gonium pectorale]|uniref:Uncharacterized protein n=1 Tax=Gonium pectorale TaxID=33097 RepID=A0A150GG55_GONPE|nr:hypothetical protein GPECTOR_25g406 [Gonium pectorale]|eukprot:KXZ48821.1 hypothetical protein GPECTOR_25g406 [Gonium pectorale]